MLHCRTCKLACSLTLHIIHIIGDYKQYKLLIFGDMEKYDYQQAVKDDIKQYIEDHDVTVTTSNREELEEQLYDKMWVSDQVTGNASGSYTFNAWQAEENLCHNLDLLKEACEEFCSDCNILESAESCDVTIRCYLLSSCLAEVLDELEEEDDDEDSDDDQ